MFWQNPCKFVNEIVYSMFKSLTIVFLSAILIAPASIDKLSYYKAFESNSEEKIESKLSNLEKMSASTTKDAYIGALIMKHSQFWETPKEKATHFREGKNLLEQAISSKPTNAEFRFLRLAIQENTPKVLKYKINLEEDKNLIIEKFGTLDAIVKKVIKTYAKSSNILSEEQFK